MSYINNVKIQRNKAIESLDSNNKLVKSFFRGTFHSQNLVILLKNPFVLIKNPKAVKIPSCAEILHDFSNE